MIDWTAPLCTKHETPIIGRYLGTDRLDDSRHRVEVFSPSLLTTSFPGPKILTVFRYGADGKARGDGEPSDNDLVNFDPHDGAIRVNDQGDKIVCAKQAA